MSIKNTSLDSTSAIIDLERFRQVCHCDQDLARQLIEQISSASDQLFTEFKDAVTSEDIEEIASVTHRLLGIARYLCAITLEEAAARVEEQLIAGEMNTTSIAALFSESQKVYAFLKSDRAKENILLRF